MATIKSHTDLQQSRKFAEILPLESADMCYSNDGTATKIDANPYTVRYSMWKDCVAEIIPCWSLAALLELLPKRIEIMDNVYELSVYLYGIYYYNVNNGNLCFESKNKDNFVDACYEMIIRLNELKML